MIPRTLVQILFATFSDAKIGSVIELITDGKEHLLGWCRLRVVRYLFLPEITIYNPNMTQIHIMCKYFHSPDTSNGHMVHARGANWAQYEWGIWNIVASAISMFLWVVQYSTMRICPVNFPSTCKISPLCSHHMTHMVTWDRYSTRVSRTIKKLIRVVDNINSGHLRRNLK